jgi:hypothetical protein
MPCRNAFACIVDSFDPRAYLREVGTQLRLRVFS